MPLFLLISFWMSGLLEIVVITVTAKVITSVENRYLLWLYHISCTVVFYNRRLEHKAHMYLVSQETSI